MTNNYNLEAPKPHPSAEYKEPNGLGFWEWKENGIRKIQLTGKGVLEESETDKLAGEFLNDSHYEILAFDEDVDIYKPVESGDSNLELFGFSGIEESNPEDRLLMSLRRKVFGEEKTEPAWKILRHASKASKNRGYAAGKATAEGLGKSPDRFVAPEDLSKADLTALMEDDEQRAKLFTNAKNPMRAPSLGTAGYMTKDGYMSSTNESNMVYSGIVGNFNSTPRNPYCRQTAFTRDRFGEFLAAMPFIEDISRYFKLCIPSRFDAQSNFVKKAKLRDKGWILGNTIFSTITVNKNYRTGCHKDAGDFEAGFGNLTVLEGGKDRYAGGRTIFPRFRCAVDLRNGDFLGMDVHEWHGNTEMYSAVEGKDDWERISVVCYVRVDMEKCSTIKDENHKQAKWFAERYKTPEQRHAALIERTEREKREDREQEALLGVVGDLPTDLPDPAPSKDAYMENLADSDEGEPSVPEPAPSKVDGSTALWIVGEPGVGKTTLVREFLHGRELRYEPSPKWTWSGDWNLAGHYKGDTFDGADQLSTNVMPILDVWEKKYLPMAKVSVFDGDRFSFKGALDRISALARARVLLLVAPPEVAAARRKQRGSNQNEQWVKGRKTKSETFAFSFAEEDRLVLDATEAPEKLAAKAQAWLKGQKVESYQPPSEDGVLDMFG
jgi:hypothetical protein